MTRAGKYETHTKCSSKTTNGTMRFGRHRHRLEDNIKIDIRDLIRVSVNCFLVAEGRVRWRTFVNVVVNTWVILEHRNFVRGWVFLLTTVKCAIFGNYGGERAAGYLNFPGIITLYLMCTLVYLAT